MPIVNRGLIAATVNSKIITGTDTRFIDDNVQPGALLSFTDAQGRITTPLYVVESVEDNTHLTLVQAYAGSTGSGKSYALLDVAYEKTSADVFNLLATKTDQIEEVLDKANGVAAQGNFAVLGAGGKLSTDRLNTNTANGVLKLDAGAKVPANNLPDVVKNSNLNLLHNWDFINPVNQRGETVYLNTTKQIPTIDRWKASKDMKVEVLSGGIRITGTGSPLGVFRQNFEHANARLAGKTVTLSLNITQCTGNFSCYFLYGAPNPTLTSGFLIAAGETGVKKAVVTLPGASDMNDTLQFVVCCSDGNGASLTLKSAKVEIGSDSTLKDGDVADYSEQLMICQRFLVPLEKFNRFRMVCSVGTSAMLFLIPLPVCPRVLPSIEDTSAPVLKTIALGDISGVTISNFEALFRNTGLLLRITTGAAHGQSDAMLYLAEKTYLNAEL